MKLHFRQVAQRFKQARVARPHELASLVVNVKIPAEARSHVDGFWRAMRPASRAVTSHSPKPAS